MKLSFFVFAALAAVGCCSRNFDVSVGESREIESSIEDFVLSGEFLTEPGSSATLQFHYTEAGSGYEVLFRSGPIDGSIKSGSLLHVRNLYRPLSEDGQWTPFVLKSSGRTICVRIAGQDVVCYTEPLKPFRLERYATMLKARGGIRFVGGEGTVHFRGVTLSDVACGESCCCDSIPPLDETADRAIRFQQEDFPVIDYHVHIKGGLTREMARVMQMRYGINYGIAPNAGEGGVGEMLRTDEDVRAYFDAEKDLPFLRGVQGEGRRWTAEFSQEALGTFDYLFTDAMTIVDHKGRVSRLYRPEEVILDGISVEGYMDRIVDQTVKILSNEPADIYANPTFVPACMQADYDRLWTDERIDRVLDVLKENSIALEINARYRIPSEKIIRRAKDKGIKFTFGTNNADSDFGRLEYCLDMVRKCGLTKEDMWFPSMSVRASRPTIIYNNFADLRTVLFNGRDLDGWVKVAKEDSPTLFSVRDGAIAIEGKPFGYLRTARKYTDYKLHVEWRWVGEGTNSGIFQRVQDPDGIWPEGVECQLKAGCAGDLVCLGGARVAEIPFDPSVKFPKKERIDSGAPIEFADGEWNRAEIICRGTSMMVYINGRLENEATLSRADGYIALQSEGGPLEFRNIYLEPVD